MTESINISGDRRKLNEILNKIVAYQRSLPDGHAVELGELQSEGVLSSSDIEFMSTNSVTYKPHRTSDYHAMDMLRLPTNEGCIYVGPTGRPLNKRHARLREFQPILQSFLRMSRPREELLLFVEFTENDGMGIAPEFISFTFRSSEWRLRLASLRSLAADLGFYPFQDNEVEGNHILTFRVSADADCIVAAVAALLSQGCGFFDDTEILYSAGALDEA